MLMVDFIVNFQWTIPPRQCEENNTTFREFEQLLPLSSVLTHLSTSDYNHQNKSDNINF